MVDARKVILAEGLHAGVPVEGLLPRPDVVRPTSVRTMSPTSRDPGPDRFAPALSQAPLWFLHELDRSDTAYNIAFAWRLEGVLDPRGLEHALQQIIARHEILRARFEARHGQPWVVIGAAPERVLEQRSADAGDREALLSAFAATPFDLSRGPLYRALLVRTNATDHTLALAFHHSVFDGWSISVLQAELATLYDAYRRGETVELPPLAWQYRSFAEAQRTELARGGLAAELAHWRERLRGIPSATFLPASQQPLAIAPAGRGRVYTHVLGPALTARVDAFSRAHEATRFMTLLAAFTALLHRHGGQEDLVIGTPTANRLRPRARAMIGMLLNTLALRCDLSGRPSFAALVGRVRETCLDAYRHQSLSFDHLVEALAPKRIPGHHPIFEVMFILQSPGPPLALDGLTLTYRDIHPGAAKFDLTLTVVPDHAGLRVEWEYRTDRLDADSVAALAERYAVLLENLLTDPSRPITAVPIVRDEDARRLLARFRGPEAPERTAIALPELFRSQAARTPEAIAVRSGDAVLRYAELDARVEHVARALRAAGLERGALAAVSMQRGIDMLVALLAILRAGAAYVPIDPNLPPARIALITEDAAVAMIVTHAEVPPLAIEGARTIDMDALPHEPLHVELEPVHPQDLAYVIYTSGSTGRPKGVRIQHGPLANLLRSMIERPGIRPSDRLLAITTISFDIAALELFGPLIVGAELVIAPRGVAADAHRLTALMDREDVTLMQATPTTWRMLVDGGWPGRPGLGMWSGGEAMPPSLADELMTRGAVLWNLYGPTETTIWSTRQPVGMQLGMRPDAGVPIGEPIHNTTLVVLNEDHELVPPGEAGELYIGGLGLAEGYHARPELTAERFIAWSGPTDVTARPGLTATRLYKTGDLVRWFEDGTLEYIGRLDHQIKLRGHRIELGEIEAALLEHASVREAVVVARAGPGGEPRLVAYTVTHGAPPPVADLRAFLKRTLPAYMVPAAFVSLEAFPLTPNNKIDRQRLPEPEPTTGPSDRAIVLPRDDVELRIAQVWARLLGTQPIGVHDSFFDLGGHSLLAVQLAGQLGRAFGRDLPLQIFFTAQTVAEQAEAIRAGGGELPWHALTPIKKTGFRPPLFFIGSTGYSKALEHVLPEDQPMYGLNVFGVRPKGEGERPLDVPTLAERFVDELQVVQPSGPYYLVGYCQDCKVALEMARVLDERGHDVAMLAFIDIIWVDPGVGLKLRHYVKNLLAHGHEWVLRQLRQRVSMKRQQARILQARVQFGWRKWRGLEVPVVARDVRLLGEYLGALAAYTPAPYRGDMTVLLSGEFYSAEAAHVLAPLAAGRLDVVAVPGYHGELFGPPHVQVLADQLSRIARASDVRP